ncbi:MAG: hypothetical protein M1826_000298, partial [Phylliscum demangeonii]
RARPVSGKRATAPPPKPPPPPTKKRKMTAAAEPSSGAPARKRAAPSTARRTSNAPKTASRSRKAASSAAPSPAAAPAPIRDDDDDDDDDAEADADADADAEADADGDADMDDGGVPLYCICKKPDDGSVMIGCDGGCNDWFHAACVHVDPEDMELIDKYICTASPVRTPLLRTLLIMSPLAGAQCDTADKHTTWKRMCRLDGCRRPARRTPRDSSKYCSDAHGHAFMRKLVKLPTTARKRAGSSQGLVAEVETKVETKEEEEDDDDDDADDADDDDHRPAVGGILTTGQLAAAVTHASDDVDRFRTLGASVLSPPATAPATATMDGDPDAGPDPDPDPNNHIFTPEETARRAELLGQRARWLERRQVLQDRERFLQLVKERVERRREESSQLRDICGFDPRLVWSDDEFCTWRAREGGALLLAAGGPLPAAVPDAAAPARPDTVDGLCGKKRCERHKQWRVFQAQDLRFDQADNAVQLHRVQRELADIEQRAKMRRLRAQADHAADAGDACDAGAAVAVVGDG